MCSKGLTLLLPAPICNQGTTLVDLFVFSTRLTVSFSPPQNRHPE
jgi:hypothetical protein